MSDADDLIARSLAFADRISKPVPVVIPHLGRIFIRHRLIGEFDQARAAQEIGDATGLSLGLARLVCFEDGTRPPPEVQLQLAEIFTRFPDSFITQVSRAADGEVAEDADPN